MFKRLPLLILGTVAVLLSVGCGGTRVYYRDTPSTVVYRDVPTVVYRDVPTVVYRDVPVPAPVPAPTYQTTGFYDRFGTWHPTGYYDAWGNWHVYSTPR